MVRLDADIAVGVEPGDLHLARRDIEVRLAVRYFYRRRNVFIAQAQIQCEPAVDAEVVRRVEADLEPRG